jgi:hypothetical protein
MAFRVVRSTNSKSENLEGLCDVMDFAIIAADSGLKATPDEYNALEVALHADDEDDETYDDEALDDEDDAGLNDEYDEADDEDDGYHCFEIEYRDREVYISAPEGGNWRTLPVAFLELLGKLIAKNGLEYLEFGVAFADYWGVGGTYFRVRQDGSIWEPSLTW